MLFKCYHDHEKEILSLNFFAGAEKILINTPPHARKIIKMYWNYVTIM